MRKTSGLWRNNFSVMYSMVLVCFDHFFTMLTGFNQTAVLNGAVQVVLAGMDL